MVFCGRGSTGGIEASVTGKGSSPRDGCWGAALDVSKLGSDYQPTLVSTGGPVLVLKGRGRKWHLASSFVLGGVSP